jgi:hypothetical protein
VLKIFVFICRVAYRRWDWGDGENCVNAQLILKMHPIL